MIDERLQRYSHLPHQVVNNGTAKIRSYLNK